MSADISVDSFQDFLARIERIQNLASRIYVYAGLLFYEDTQNQTAQTLRSRVEQFVADMTNRMLFFDLWWKGLEKDRADRLLAEAGIDVSQAAFWQGGFDVLKDLVSQLEASPITR